MPKYQFKCHKCSFEDEIQMTISEFLQYKRKENDCKSCKSGYLVQKIKEPNSKIDRDKEYIIQEAKEEAKKTVEKINSGDQKVINDIYGDKPNPNKFGGEF